jgi:hypothetical protein
MNQERCVAVWIIGNSLDVGLWCFRRVASAPKQPGYQSSRCAAQMRHAGYGADSDDLFPSADDLKQNPQNKDEPRRQSYPTEKNPSPPEQESQAHVRKLQGVKRDHTGNTAACPTHGIDERGSAAMCARSPTSAASAMKPR